MCTMEIIILIQSNRQGAGVPISKEKVKLQMSYLKIRIIAQTAFTKMMNLKVKDRTISEYRGKLQISQLHHLQLAQKSNMAQK